MPIFGIQLDISANQKYIPVTSRRHEGTKRVRHVALARVAMDACGVRCFGIGRNAAAYGEVVWSWRRDPGVYPRRPVLAGQR